MSDWSSFEKDKAYTDQWRSFLTEKNLPKEQEEAINESVKDWFSGIKKKITGGSSDDGEQEIKLPSQEKKERDVAEVLNKFQDAFVEIFNKVKNRLHPDLLDDLNNIEMPTDEEVAATKEQPKQKDDNDEGAPSDETSAEEENEESVAAESINRINSFIKLLNEVTSEDAPTEPSNPAIQQHLQVLHSYREGLIAFLKTKLSSTEGMQINSPDDITDELLEEYHGPIPRDEYTTFLDSIKAIAEAGGNRLEEKDVFDKLLYDVVVSLKASNKPEAPEGGSADTGETTTDQEEVEEKQMTSLAHFFDLYYSTRFGSIPSSGNIKLREKIIRQLASLLQRGTANDTILGMFTYLNRIYKQRARNLGRSDTGQDGQQAGEATIIYLNEKPPQGYENQKSAFKNYLMQKADLSEEEVVPIIEAFKQDLIDAKFVVKEAVKAKLTRTMTAIGKLENEKQLKVKQAFKELLTKYELSPESNEGNLFFSMNDDGAASDDDEGDGDGDGGTVISLDVFREIIDLEGLQGVKLKDNIEKSQYPQVAEQLASVVDIITGKEVVNNNIPISEVYDHSSIKRLLLSEEQNNFNQIFTALGKIDALNKTNKAGLETLKQLIGISEYNFELAIYVLFLVCSLVNREDAEATRLLKILFKKHMEIASESISYDRM